MISNGTYTDPGNYFVVVGCGYFGREAIKKIHQLNTEAKIIAVDEDADNLARVAPLAVETYQQNGENFLAECYLSVRCEGNWWIIPAIPRHLVYEGLTLIMKNDRNISYVEKVPLPDITFSLPFEYRSDEYTFYLSIADFTCPEDCSSPQDYCIKTGKSRPVILYEMLEEAEIENHVVLVIRSWQLAPGLGGFQIRQLRELHRRIQSAENQNFIVATSCQCHAVLNALNVGYVKADA